MLVMINKTMGEPLWGDILLWIENMNLLNYCAIYINIYTTYALEKGLQRMLIY